jgi:DNA-binding transcriptional MocR family regulator
MLAITSDQRLAASDHAVAMRVLDHCDAKGRAWPSVERLMSQTGCSKSTVLRSIDRLVAKGYFSALRSRGRGKSNVYQAQFSRAEKVSAVTPFAPPENVSGVTPFEAGNVSSVTPFPLKDPTPENVSSVTEKGVTGDIKRCQA